MMMPTQLSLRIAAIILIAAVATSASVIQPAKADNNWQSYQITPLHASINLGENETLFLPIHNSALKTYDFTVNITSPTGYQSHATKSMITNGVGNGNRTLYYPTEFSANPRPANTAEIGTYSITVYLVQNGDSSLVATSNFRVDSHLTVNILQQKGTDFLPGERFSLAVNVLDINNASYTAAEVGGSIAGTDILLNFNSTGPGEYATAYEITEFIPQNSLFVVQAQDAFGNAGQTVVILSPQHTSIVVGQLHVTDQQGKLSSEVSLGETVYFGFNATYPNGTLVKSADAKVSVISGSGSSAILQTKYSDIESLFVTTQGFKLPENSSMFTLEARVLMTDAFGTMGSTAPMAVSLPTAPAAPGNTGAPGNTLAPGNLSGTLSMFPLFSVVPGVMILAGGGASFYMFRRAKRQVSLREFREALLQNKKHSFLFAGRKKVGMNSLLIGLLREDLNSDVSSIYLNFEMPLSRLTSHMISGGINLLDRISENSLRILDCSDLNASLDLTNLRFRIASSLMGINSETFSLYIDSLTLPFEDLPTDQVVAFLRGLSEEVIRRRGTIYSTVRLTRIVKKNLPSIREVFGSLFEITASNTRSKGTKLSLVGVSEAMERTPIGELKLTADSKVEMQIPPASGMEKKIRKNSVDR